MLLKSWRTGWFAKAGSVEKADQKIRDFSAVLPMKMPQSLGEFFSQIAWTTSEANSTGISKGSTLAVSGLYTSMHTLWEGIWVPNKNGIILCKSRSALLMCLPQQAKEAKSRIVWVSRPSRSAALEYLCNALTWSSSRVFWIVWHKNIWKQTGWKNLHIVIFYPESKIDIPAPLEIVPLIGGPKSYHQIPYHVAGRYEFQWGRFPITIQLHHGKHPTTSHGPTRFQELHHHAVGVLQGHLAPGQNLQGRKRLLDGTNMKWFLLLVGSCELANV